LKLPLPDPATVQRLADALAGLLAFADEKLLAWSHPLIRHDARA